MSGEEEEEEEEMGHIYNSEASSNSIWILDIGGLHIIPFGYWILVGCIYKVEHICG